MYINRAIVSIADPSEAKAESRAHASTPASPFAIRQKATWLSR